VIRVAPWFYTIFWLIWAVVGLIMMAGMAAFVSSQLPPNGEPSADVANWVTFVASGIIGILLLWWAVRRLRHPLKPPQAVSKIFE
jgi:Na+/melibiose symporter-like transporter